MRPGYAQPDSLDALYSRGSDLASLLRSQGWNVLATGGSGQSGQVRNGGFSPDHTQFWWHGLEINSLTLGAADVSLLPAFLFPYVQLSAMPEAGFVPGAALAGAVQLAPGPRIKRGMEVEWTGNSIENTTLGLRRGSKWGKASVSTAVHGTWANNRFTYTDSLKPGFPSLTRLANRHRQLHLTQELSLPVGSNGRFEAYMWAYGRSVEVPPTEGSFSNTHNLQLEKGLRLSTAYTQLSRHLYRLSTSHALETFLYGPGLCATCAIDTLSFLPTQRHTVSAGMTVVSNTGKALMDAAVRVTHNLVNSPTHGGLVRRTDPQIRLTLPFLGDKGVLSVQHIFRPRLLPNATLTWRSNPRIKGWLYRIQLGHRSRQPDFNELYWSPGGNPDLRPETGFTADGILGYGTAKWKATASVGGRRLQNAIVWNYDAVNAYWSPFNVGAAWHVQVQTKTALTLQRFQLSSLLTWQRGKSQTPNTGAWTKAIYLPQFSTHTRLGYSWKKWLLSAAANSQSQRLRSVQESVPAMPGFVLVDAAIRFAPSKTTTLEIGVNNLFDTYTRQVFGYPMPGRVIQLNLHLLLS